MKPFEGIPAGAFTFYSELEHNNNREWWQEHKDRYESLVRGPLAALLGELEPTFGPGKIFRPYRDMRFARDKVPYKAAQGAFASAREGVGYYLLLNAHGLLVAGGYRSSSPAQLARLREAVDAPEPGEALRQVVETVTAAGFAMDGTRLRTTPRGYNPGHPRADLLRFTTLSAALELGRPEWLGTPAAAAHIAKLWERLRPLVQWTSVHAAP